MSKDFRVVYNEIAAHGQAHFDDMLRERGVECYGSDLAVEGQMAVILHLLDRIKQLEEEQ